MEGRAAINQPGTAESSPLVARWERYLECLEGISSQLLAAPNPHSLLPALLQWLCEVAEASRCYYFECSRDAAGRWRGALRLEADAPGIPPLSNDPALAGFDLAERGMGRFAEALSAGKAIGGRAEELPAGERKLLAAQGIAAFINLPLLVRGDLVGFVGFDYCDPAVLPAGGETALLRSAANVVSTALERVEAERELRETHGLLANILRSNRDLAVIATDLDFHIILVNPAMERLAGLGLKELYGCPLPDCGVLARLGVVDPASLFAMLRRSGFVEQELDNMEDQEKRRVLHLALSGFSDERGQAQGYMAVVQDITRERVSERALFEQERMASVGLLAGGIAHDFNNILMGILGYASLAKDRIEADHPAYRMLSVIEQSAERAAALTRELLAYARGGKMQSVPVRLDQQVTEILNIIATSLPKGVRVEQQVEGSVPYVMADPVQIQQVIMNLCLNAGEAIAHRSEMSGAADYRGEIVVRISTVMLAIAPPTIVVMPPVMHPGDYVHLAVRDDGCGIDSETLGRIFEPFFTTKFTGRGLGLSAVEGIIRNHGGLLGVESVPGSGSTFSMYLPVPSEIGELAEEEHLAVLGGLETILVADDEEVVRQLALLTLTNLGYSVLLASNASEALQVFQDQADTIGLVLLDLTMPGLSSLAALEAIKQVNDAVPVIMTSGYDEGALASGVVRESASGFLQKPYTPEALARAVRAILDDRAKVS